MPDKRFLRGTAAAMLLAALSAGSFAAAPADATRQMSQLNADAATPVLARGADGVPVLRAQVLLDRNWFSVGEIDGKFGTNMAHAVKAFQQARGLQPSGKVDAATWQALQQGQQAPAFGTYTVTEQDLAGPFVKIPEDPQEQAKLDRLAYQTPLEALGERFHMSPKLIERLNQGRRLQAGTQLVLADTTRAVELPKATSLRIDKSEEMLYVMGEGGRLMGAVPVSIGSQKDPLPIGQLRIEGKHPDPTFTYDPDLLRTVKIDRKIEVPAGPNSPVGVMWMQLSKPHWGIHGTSEPSQMRKVQTNGCVRLTNWDVERLSRIVDAGTVVNVQG